MDAMDPTNRECMVFTIGLQAHHEEMIGKIIAGARITCARPGNPAFGAALRCASKIAEHASAGATHVEFIKADKSMEIVPIEALWK